MARAVTARVTERSRWVVGGPVGGVSGWLDGNDNLSSCQLVLPAWDSWAAPSFDHAVTRVAHIKGSEGKVLVVGVLPDGSRLPEHRKNHGVDGGHGVEEKDGDEEDCWKKEKEQKMLKQL